MQNLLSPFQNFPDYQATLDCQKALQSIWKVLMLSENRNFPPNRENFQGQMKKIHNARLLSFCDLPYKGKFGLKIS